MIINCENDLDLNKKFVSLPNKITKNNIMKATTITFENNVYSFNVLASNGSGNIIDTYEVSIEENFNNEYEVASFSIGSIPKYKTFKTEDDANAYAMKLIYKLKKQY